MTSIVAQLIEDNLTVLGQGRALVEGLNATQFTENAPTLALSGVGPHLRHVVDFYERFLAAIEDCHADPAPLRVDYDARERDPLVEVDPGHAVRTIDRTVDRLRALRTALIQRADTDAPHAAVEPEEAGATPARSPGMALLVRSDGSPWVESNVSRELQSLVSHTVHHFALIAIAVRSQGGDPGPEFGVAPSTLRHWEAERACGLDRSGSPSLAARF